MLDVINWVLDHAEGLVALGAILTALATASIWVIRMFIAREVKKMMGGAVADVAIIKRAFQPVNADGSPGPALTETLQTMASSFKATATDFNSGMKMLQSDIAQIKIATQGNTARQRAILAVSATPTFETDKAGACIWANPALLNLLERPFDEIRGRGWAVAIHRLDRQDGVTEWDEAVREQRTYEAAYRIVGRNSGKIWRVKCTASPLFCDTNAMTGYMGRYESVTEVKDS